MKYKENKTIKENKTNKKGEKVFSECGKLVGYIHRGEN